MIKQILKNRDYFYGELGVLIPYAQTQAASTAGTKISFSTFLSSQRASTGIPCTTPSPETAHSQKESEKKRASSVWQGLPFKVPDWNMQIFLSDQTINEKKASRKSAIVLGNDTQTHRPLWQLLLTETQMLEREWI